MMPYQRELDVARAAAIHAGAVALRYQLGITAEIKADDSPVTMADRECERIFAAAFEEAFPDDGLLGEEGAEKPSRSGRRWIVDPIDGTRDYVRGNRLWAMLLALEAGGEVVAGVAHFPGLAETYYASRGGGAWCNDVRIHASSITDISQAVLCSNNLNDVPDAAFGARLLKWLEGCWAVRSLGGALDAIFVISGKAEAWVEISAKPWDLAAFKILAEEAGARFFNLDGGASIYGGNCAICAPGVEADVRGFLDLPH